MKSQKFLKFYVVLARQFILREYADPTSAPDENSVDVWRDAERIIRGKVHYISTLEFGTKGAMNREYFYTIKRRAEKNPDVAVNILALQKALIYLGYTLPDELDNEEPGLEVQRIEILLKQFDGVEFKKKPTNKPIFDSLHNTVFISEAVQDRRIDRLYMKLETEGENQIRGKFVVNFQGEDDSYVDPEHPEILCMMNITGFFLYESLLIFSFINNAIGALHAGVELLKYNSSKGFAGYYLVHFKPKPPLREKGYSGVEDLGQMVFQRCSNESLAQKFILFQDDETLALNKEIKYRTTELY